MAGGYVYQPQGVEALLALIESQQRQITAVRTALTKALSQALLTPNLAGLAGPASDTAVLTWPATTSATFVTISDGYWQIGNPLLAWHMTLLADAATVGQYQVRVAGQVVSTVQNRAAGTSAEWIAARVALPAGVNVGDIVYTEIQALRVSGTGSVRAILHRWSGDQ